MLRQVDRVTISGELRKSDHIGGRYRFRKRLSHADREVLEVKRTQGKDHSTDGHGGATSMTEPIVNLCVDPA